MAMQDVTIWWSKNCNFACVLKFQVVKNYQPNISKIELKIFVAHSFLMKSKVVHLVSFIPHQNVIIWHP